MAAGDNLNRKDRRASGLGFKKTPKKAPAKSKTSLRSSQAKARAATSNRQYSADHAKARTIRATQARKKAGTSSNYDPLSSISTKKSAGTKATKQAARNKSAAKAKRVRKRNR